MLEKGFNKQDKILIANTLDKYKYFNKSGNSTHTNFLNQEKLKLITNYLDY